MMFITFCAGVETGGRVTGEDIGRDATLDETKRPALALISILKRFSQKRPKGGHLLGKIGLQTGKKHLKPFKNVEERKRPWETVKDRERS